MSASIQFCGAARTVTGSRHLLRLGKKIVLVDCGLFQGARELRDRNWEPFPVDPTEIDAIVLTHAHADHIGYLPRLVKLGYRGPVYSTSGTRSLARLSLPDSGRLQEEEARYRNKVGATRFSPALPLYTERDAYDALKQFETVRYGERLGLPGGATLVYLPAGHIMGSAFAEITLPGGERLLMSGDLGRYNTPIIKDPTPVAAAEYLVIESTYGNRLHTDANPQDQLEELVGGAIQAGHCVLVPSFAIGRTQDLLFHLRALQDAGRLPRFPIFVDSPMASRATVEYLKASEEHDLETQDLSGRGENPLEPDYLEFVRDREASKELNVRPGPMLIISGSGMASGGRVVHHLKQRLPDPNTLVLFTGYQSVGTLGRRLVDGEQTVTIMRQEVSVRARIEMLDTMSAHADQREILTWLRNFEKPPKRTFLVHGEPDAQDTLRAVIEKELGWEVAVPSHLETCELA
ncbi:MAG: MBL fold metallo-hydrolase [Fimbriimonadaceae bacterium]